ncbi:MAG: anti-sigma factor family protein [Longimicrobiales bacterium]
MSAHPHEDRLQDLVEGVLSTDERAAIEAHLADCAACRADVDSMREVVTRLAALPRDIAPAHDLRGGIWQKIDEEYDAIDPGTAVPRRAETAALRPRFGQRTLASARYVLAAAAVVLVVLTSALTLLVQRRTAGQPMAGPIDDGPAGATQLAGDMSAVEARYRVATQELQQLLDEQRTQLSPETVRLLEENLLIIDRALTETREALAIQPGNIDLSRILFATWEKKLDLLRTATQGQAGI